MGHNQKRTVLAALSAAAAATLAYSVFIEPFQIETVHLNLFCPRLPDRFDGYRILQLSDFHLRKIGKRENILRSAIEALPGHDLILITGDLIHTPGGTKPFLELAQDWSATDGIFAVFGNSEHKNGVRANHLASELEKQSIVPLLNKHISIERHGQKIYLLGVDDPVSFCDDMRVSAAGVPSEAFKILMMHSPDPIGQAAAFGIDLVLSGHTHGGQISVPFLGPLHTSSVHGLTMSNGLYSGAALYRIVGFRPGRTQLYVSRGIGVSGLALRFLTRPEITSITLHSKPVLE